MIGKEAEKQENSGLESQAGRKKRRWKKELILFAERAAALALFLWILFGVVFGLQPMNNNDMLPRLSYGDLTFYFRLEKDFKASDVVVYKADGQKHIGRVAARPGDTITITEDSGVEINGNRISEPDIFYMTPRYETEVEYPVTLQDDEYFILGDYREGAMDSRVYGAIHKKDILGRVIGCLRRDDI